MSLFRKSTPDNKFNAITTPARLIARVGFSGSVLLCAGPYPLAGVVMLFLTMFLLACCIYVAREINLRGPDGPYRSRSGKPFRRRRKDKVSYENDDLNGDGSNTGDRSIVDILRAYMAAVFNQPLLIPYKIASGPILFDEDRNWLSTPYEWDIAQYRLVQTYYLSDLILLEYGFRNSVFDSFDTNLALKVALQYKLQQWAIEQAILEQHNRLIALRNYFNESPYLITTFEDIQVVECYGKNSLARLILRSREARIEGFRKAFAEKIIMEIADSVAEHYKTTKTEKEWSFRSDIIEELLTNRYSGRMFANQELRPENKELRSIWACFRNMENERTFRSDTFEELLVNIQPGRKAAGQNLRPAIEEQRSVWISFGKEIKIEEGGMENRKSIATSLLRSKKKTLEMDENPEEDYSDLTFKGVYIHCYEEVVCRKKRRTHQIIYLPEISTGVRGISVCGIINFN